MTGLVYLRISVGEKNLNRMHENSKSGSVDVVGDGVFSQFSCSIFKAVLIILDPALS